MAQKIRKKNKKEENEENEENKIIDEGIANIALKSLAVK